MNLGFTIWVAMCWNGATIGMAVTPLHCRRIQWAQPLVLAAWSVVVAGAALRGIAECRPVITTRSVVATTISACAWCLNRNPLPCVAVGG